MFQQIYLIESMSLLDNVLVAGLLLKTDRKALVQKAKALLQSVDIGEALWHKLPAQLSGGEAQRAGVARACINDPKILFADEPTGALDSVRAQSVLDVLTACNARGQSIVMVTHDIRSALRGNRILYLKDGAVEAELTLAKYAGEDEGRRDKMRAFLERQGW